MSYRSHVDNDRLLQFLAPLANWRMGRFKRGGKMRKKVKVANWGIEDLDRRWKAREKSESGKLGKRGFLWGRKSLKKGESDIITVCKRGGSHLMRKGESEKSDIITAWNCKEGGFHLIGREREKIITACKSCPSSEGHFYLLYRLPVKEIVSIMFFIFILNKGSKIPKLTFLYLFPFLFVRMVDMWKTANLCERLRGIKTGQTITNLVKKTNKRWWS